MTGTTLISILVAAGAFSAMAETLRWFLTRGTARIDSAKVVQGMALDMLTPLHNELAATAEEVKTLRKQVYDAQGDIEALVAWAVAAKHILDSHELEYPPVPQAIHRGH